jgi:hypothetical protein
LRHRPAPASTRQRPRRRQSRFCKRSCPLGKRARRKLNRSISAAGPSTLKAVCTNSVKRQVLGSDSIQNKLRQSPTLNSSSKTAFWWIVESVFRTTIKNASSNIRTSVFLKACSKSNVDCARAQANPRVIALPNYSQAGLEASQRQLFLAARMVGTFRPPSRVQCEHEIT